MQRYREITFWSEATAKKSLEDKMSLAHSKPQEGTCSWRVVPKGESAGK